MQYWYSNDGVQDGPYSLEQIQSFHLSDSTLIYRSDQTNWKQKFEFSELEFKQTFPDVKMEKKQINVLPKTSKVQRVNIADVKRFLQSEYPGLTIQNGWLNKNSVIVASGATRAIVKLKANNKLKVSGELNTHNAGIIVIILIGGILIGYLIPWLINIQKIRRFKEDVISKLRKEYIIQ